MAQRLPPVRFVLAALVALALVALGPGHPGNPAGGMDRMLGAYLQSGGSLDDLCLTDPAAPGQGGQQDCPVCALGKVLALANPGAVPALAGLSAAVPVADGACHLADGHAPRAPPARGPPFTLV